MAAASVAQDAEVSLLSKHSTSKSRTGPCEARASISALRAFRQRVSSADAGFAEELSFDELS